MIDAGITGGEHIYAGELVRILINHPDVNLKWIASDNKQGKVVDIHRGLEGECDLEISAPNLEEVDVVFACDSRGLDMCNNALEEFHELRVIDLTRHQVQGCMYGLCEVNRKYMVHDCYGTVTVPSPLAMVSLLPLVPLAKAQLLPSSQIDISITCCERWLTTGTPQVVKEMQSVLTAMQPSFNCQAISLTTASTSNPREIKACITMRAPGNVQVITKLCEDYYDDHNFTFVVNHEPDASDVNNTNKCLLNLQSDGDNLKMTAVIDGLLKGTAGNAVHIMNLLFGLHERVGLALKAQVF